MTKSIASLSKMWHNILNIENTLFPAFKETLRLEELSPKESKFILIKHERESFKIINQHLDLDKEQYNQRSMVERVNKYLKDDFGCDKIYYQGVDKVASVLAFGILSICIHQSFKLVT